MDTQVSVIITSASSAASTGFLKSSTFPELKLFKILFAGKFPGGQEIFKLKSKCLEACIQELQTLFPSPIRLNSSY